MIPGKRGSGCICINGAAAHLVHVGDTVIIMAYALMTEDEVKKYSFHISNCKNKNMSLLQYQKENEFLREIDNVMRVFYEYERRLKEMNALDFDGISSF